MRKNSVKNTRVNGEVQRVLAEIIRGGLKDPRISPWTSVVAVEGRKTGNHQGEHCHHHRFEHFLVMSFSA